MQNDYMHTVRKNNKRQADIEDIKSGFIAIVILSACMGLVLTLVIIM